MKVPKLSALPIALMALTAFLGGCGESGPDPKIEEARVNDAKSIRGIYEASGGDYSKVSATDKAAIEKYAGGGAGAEKLWKEMQGGLVDTPSGPNQ